MYVEDCKTRRRTHPRAQVAPLTAPIAHGHHVLEDILAHPLTGRFFRRITRRNGQEKSLFEKLCENYDNPSLRGLGRLRWLLPNLLIDLGLKRARLDKATMKKNLFHHPPTVKALALTAKSIARYGLTVPQRFTAPLFVVWNVTQACNLTCRHCYQDAQHKPLAAELSTAEKLALIDQFAEEMVPFIAFAGGEPLVAKDIWQVFEHCRKRGVHVTVATNGTLLSAENCTRLRDLGVKYVEVSLDSPDASQHDTFRGMPGAWQRSVQGIRNSVAAGLRTGMATCFTRETAHRADEMVQFAIELGCKTFAFFNFIPVGRGREMMHEDLTPSQREVLLRVLQRRLAEGQINIISTAPQFGRACIAYGPQEGIFATGHAGGGQGRKTMVLARYIGGCGAGRCYCCVQPDGAITPCVYIPTPVVGHVREKAFREIWDNELFAVLSDREDRGDHCGVCDYRNYCGGCRARAWAYTQDMTAGDPGCLYNHHVWEELGAVTGASAGVDVPLSALDSPAAAGAAAPEPLFPCSEMWDEGRQLLRGDRDAAARGDD